MENSDSSWTRGKCLRFLERLQVKDEAAFKLIENFAVSDEMKTVRASALRTLYKLFPEKSIPALKWSFDHDISPHKMCINRRGLPFLTILDLLGQNNDLGLKKFREKLFAEIEPNVHNYINEGVAREEAIVLAMFERQIYFKLNKIEYDEKVDFSRELLDYKIDREGHVVGIYLMSGGDGWTLYFIPKRISVMTHLKDLYFHNCILEEIPDSIGKLKSLEVLYLSFNYINEIPNSVGSLISLKKLNLSYNKLDSLPQSLSQLNSLERLDIDYNKFKELPECISSLKNLKTLNFSKCKKKIGKYIYQKITSIGYGCLDCNHEWENSSASKEKRVACVNCNSKNVYYLMKEFYRRKFIKLSANIE